MLHSEHSFWNDNNSQWHKTQNKNCQYLVGSATHCCLWFPFVFRNNPKLQHSMITRMSNFGTNMIIFSTLALQPQGLLDGYLEQMLDVTWDPYIPIIEPMFWSWGFTSDSSFPLMHAMESIRSWFKLLGLCRLQGKPRLGSWVLIAVGLNLSFYKHQGGEAMGEIISFCLLHK